MKRIVGGGGGRIKFNPLDFLAKAVCSDKLEAKLILWCTYTKSPWIIEAAKCLNCQNGNGNDLLRISSPHQPHYHLPFDFSEPFISKAPQVPDENLVVSRRKSGTFLLLLLKVLY